MKRTCLVLTLFTAYLLGGCAPTSIESTPEMKAFLGKFNGDPTSVENALKEFGADSTIMHNEMAMYALKDAIVNAKEGDCWVMSASAGKTTRTYSICWSKGKINKIEDRTKK